MEKKPLLLKMLLFSLLFFTTSYVVNYVFITSVMQASSIYMREHSFETNKHDVKVLVAGDSHPRYSVKAKYLDHSYVVATLGENIIQIYYRLHNYIEVQHLDIELVVLPIDLHTLSSFHADRFLRTDFWRHFINYTELGRVKGNIPQYWMLRLSGEFSYIGGVNPSIEMVKETRDNLIPDQIYIQEDPETRPALRARGRVWMHLKGKDLLQSDLVYYFIWTLKMLQSHDIEIVLIRFPVKKIYYTEANKLMDTDEHYREVEDLLEENRISYTILDYHDLYWEHPEYFRDADHLNANASNAFSQKINADLNQLGLYP